MKNTIRVLAFLSLFGTGFQTKAQVSVGISVRVGPPALPVYTQPLCPGEGYFVDTGLLGVRQQRLLFGFLAPGFYHPSQAFYGHRVTGDLTAGIMDGTADTGDTMLVFTEA